MRPVRARSKTHLVWVADQPCEVCQADDVQAHHLLTAQPKAMSRRAGDQWVVPLCCFHHAILHSVGEMKFFREHDLRDYKGRAKAYALASPVKKIREAAGL